MFNVKRLAKYLATGEMPEMTALDESLAEHDKKYHPDGYKEGDRCNKREEMAKNDDEKIPERGSNADGTLSDERRSDVVGIIDHRVAMLGSPMTSSYSGVHERKLSPLTWEGNKFECEIDGMSENDVDWIKRQLTEPLYYSKNTDFDNFFALKMFELSNVGYDVKKYDSGAKYTRDWEPTGIHKGDPIFQYKMTIYGTVKDKKEEIENNIAETTDKVFDIARQAVGDSDRFEVKRMVGKRNFESGKPYEVIGIYDKKLGITELTYVVGGNDGKTVTSRLAGSGESVIGIDYIDSDVRNYIR